MPPSDSVPTCPAAAEELGAATSATQAGIPAAAWTSLDEVNLATELQHPVPTLQDVPPFVRAAVRGALVCALRRLHSDYAHSAGDIAATSRVWKLFLLAPRMLLARTAQQGAEGRAELLARAAAFERGDWTRLLREVRANSGKPGPTRPAQDAETLETDRQRRACVKVKMGELTRACHILTAAELAPGDETTYRPPEPRTEVPAAVQKHQPAQPVRLTAKAVAAALRDARRGGVAGLSGMRAEHLKLLLQDLDAVNLLTEAATRLARAQVPTDVADGLARTRLTALRKTDGGCEASLPGTCFAAWCHEPSRRRGPGPLTRRLARTSSRCRRGLARML